ncbi:MAG: sensor histidine kinase [Anaerolineae bacterium]
MVRFAGLMNLANLILALAAISLALIYYRRMGGEKVERSWRYFLAALGLFATAEALGALEGFPIPSIRVLHRFLEFCSLLSFVIAFRLLYGAEQQKRQNLTTLQQMGSLLGSIVELDVLLERVLDILQHTLGFEGCSIMLADEERGELYLAAARGLGAEVRGMQEHHIPLNSRLLKEAVEKKIALISESLVPQMGMASHPHFLAIPLVANDKVVGLMNIHRPGLSTLPQDQLDLLTTLGAEAAVAIESARLCQEVSRVQALSALVQEMHHRIKNNLQTVADLLSLEMAQERSPSARICLQTCITRLKSIAAVHELLSTDHLELTDIRELARYVLDIAVQNMVAPQRRIQASVNGPSVFLPSKQATALALVMNELVSNALEHAFVGREEGRLAINLAEGTSEVVITVRDDGIGLPEGFDIAANGGLGLHIARTLVEKDLGGSLILQDGKGTTATVRFHK